MSALLQQAFRTAASELGMASAAWLFVREAAATEGDAGVAALRDELGRSWPVLDAVGAGWLDGARAALIQSDELLADLVGSTRLVVVGLESEWLDHLVAILPATVQVGLVQQGDPVTHWSRVVSNYGGRVRLLQLADFQSWAGPRSALLTFVYGQAHDHVFVLPGWLRVCGSDVRMQFRALLGWRVLDAPMDVYPRWLVAASVNTLTSLRPSAW
jgi:hypothetical protein